MQALLLLTAALCPDQRSIDAALEERQLSERVSVEVSYRNEGRRIALAARIASRTSTASLERSWILSQRDCASVPGLLVAVAEQFVRDLPARSWPSGPIPPHESARFSTRRTPISIQRVSSWGVVAGIGQGLGERGSEGRLHAWLALPIAGALELGFGIGGAIARRTVAEGSALAISPRTELALAHPFFIDGFAVAPVAGAAAGLYLAAGTNFDENHTAVLPLAEVSLGAIVETPWGVGLSARVERAIVRQSVIKGDDAFQEPAFRAVVMIGWIGGR